MARKEFSILAYPSHTQVKPTIKTLSNSTGFSLISVIQFIFWIVYFIQDKIEIHRETCGFLFIIIWCILASICFYFAFSLAQKHNKISLYLHWIIASAAIGAVTFFLLFPPVSGFAHYFSYMSIIQVLHCAIKFPIFFILLIFMPILAVAFAENVLAQKNTKETAHNQSESAYKKSKVYAEKPYSKQKSISDISY